LSASGRDCRGNAIFRGFLIKDGVFGVSSRIIESSGGNTTSRSMNDDQLRQITASGP
jgi:hypothetical protein